jgi:hypothetical protein
MVHVCPSFVQNIDRLLRTHASDHFRKVEALLAALPPRCLVFAAYCSRALAPRAAPSSKRDGPTSFARLFGSLDAYAGGPGSGGDEPSLFDRFGRGGGGGRGGRRSTKAQLLARMLSNALELHPPNQAQLVSGWGACQVSS